MPLYDGSLQDLIMGIRSSNPAMVPQATMNMTNRMLTHILDALDFVHTQDPPIIHRDIKPGNILYQRQGEKFLLTDFGIARVVDTSTTMAGTQWYAAPEIHESGMQTPKVDIYSLGVTVLECLVGFEPETKRKKTFNKLDMWHSHIQSLFNQHAPEYSFMLAYKPSLRPTAGRLLESVTVTPICVPLHNPHAHVTTSGSEVSLFTNQMDMTMLSIVSTPMDWTRTVATAFFHGDL